MDNKWDMLESSNEDREKIWTKNRTFAGDVWFRFRHKPTSIAGFVIILLLILFAAFGPLFTKYSYSVQDLEVVNIPPRMKVYETPDNTGYLYITQAMKVLQVNSDGTLGIQLKKVREESENGCSILDYWKKRAIRILPVYYLVIIYGIILHLVIMKEWRLDELHLYWLRYLLLLNCIVPRAVEGYWNNLYATWTIFIFVFFYFFLPFIKSWVKTFKISIVMEILFILLTQISIMYGGGWLWPIEYMQFFGIGIIAYFAIKDKKITVAMWIYGSFLLIFLIYRDSISMTLIYSIIFVMILLGTLNTQIRHLKAKTFILFLDKYSYTFYLSHAIIMEVIDLIKKNYILSKFSIMLIAILGSIFLSYIVKNCENKITKQLFKRKRLNES